MYSARINRLYGALSKRLKNAHQSKCLLFWQQSDLMAKGLFDRCILYRQMTAIWKEKEKNFSILLKTNKHTEN